MIDHPTLAQLWSAAHVCDPCGCAWGMPLSAPERMSRHEATCHHHRHAMSTDLKPCPFCAGTATLEDERLIFVVRCTGCGACVLGERAPEPEEDLPDGYWEPFRQSTIDRWNRRAALAQPEPVGATDEELKAAYWEAFKNAAPCGAYESWLSGLRAVARWGRPAITPIPVSERLPGAEDCAPWPDEPGANHWCWLGQKDEGGWHWAQASAMGMDADQLEWSLAGGGWTHWLPHWALPLPTTT